MLLAPLGALLPEGSAHLCRGEHPGERQPFAQEQPPALLAEDMAKLGGNGPDWDRCAQALQLRDSVTLETWVLFLEGAFPSNGPYFMPSLNEQYTLRREEA